jgi:hypothetical protein
MSCRIALLAAILAASFASSPTAQQPTFKSGVDLIRLDVHVVGDDGTPVKDLTADDFDVKVNGKAAPVRALQFLDLARTERTASEEARYRDVSTNQESLRGRLTILVIDESSLPEDTRPLMASLAKYLKTLGPEDLTALIALPRARPVARLHQEHVRTGSAAPAHRLAWPWTARAVPHRRRAHIRVGRDRSRRGSDWRQSGSLLDRRVAHRRAGHLLRGRFLARRLKMWRDRRR